MNTNLTVQPTHALSAHSADPVPKEKLQMLTDAIMKGADRQEAEFFAEVCNRVRLDPFRKQIHAVQRWDSKAKRMIWSFQTGVDGFRAIAHRTGLCAGIDDAIFNPRDESTEFPHSATVAVYRIVAGQRVPFTATARWKEYVQTTKEGNITSMWLKLPYSQLAKCFDTETEVLTSNGFKKFADVRPGDLIGAVRTDGDGLDFVNATPFAQDYEGPMVSFESDMLDFNVTPNHDMVTNLGKMEARAMLALASSKSDLCIPLRLPPPVAASDQRDEMKLLGYILADGSSTASGKWKVVVGKDWKIQALDGLELHQSRNISHSKGKVATVGTREIRSNFDRVAFLYEALPGALTKDKTLADAFLHSLSPIDAKLILDAWQQFDGYTNKTTGVRRIYATDLTRTAQIEVLAVLAGYAISRRRSRISDLSEKPNHYFTISGAEQMPVKRWINNPNRPSITEVAYQGLVWCVTVPTGMIVVRRNGFSMICGNCAECLALRKAFPEEIGDLRADEEMAQASNPDPAPRPLNRLERIPEDSPPPTREAAAEIVQAEIVTDPKPEPKPKPPGRLPKFMVPDEIMTHAGGRWKFVETAMGDKLGNLKWPKVLALRQSLPEGLRPALLASYIDEILATLDKAGLTEEQFGAMACERPDLDLGFDQDLWMNPALYPALIDLAKSLVS